MNLLAIRSDLKCYMLIVLTHHLGGSLETADTGMDMDIRFHRFGVLL